LFDDNQQVIINTICKVTIPLLFTPTYPPGEAQLLALMYW